MCTISFPSAVLFPFYLSLHPLIFSLPLCVSPCLHSPPLLMSFIHPSAKPENSASPVTVVAGTKPITVASCKSANGQPAAEISWVTTANGNYTTKQQPGTDNTLTVISEYIMVPTPNDNGKEITCVVSHRTLVKPESFKMNLAVQCKTSHKCTYIHQQLF